MRICTRISSIERLVSLLVVFSLAISAESVVLDVQYPVEGNYSFVRLTCVGEFGDPLDGDQRPAVFLRNGSDLNNGSSELVSVMMETEDSIFFFFDQTQEGEFSCGTALGEESSPEQLAASPPPGYATIEMVHYVVLPSPESNRSIVLSCAIRPGALAGRYSVVWEQVDQNNNSFINENKPDILVDVDSTAATPSQYQCNVTIQHNSVTSVSYTPPPVTVHYKVLSTLIGDVSETVGELATFYCSILKRDTDFNITWRVGNNEYICDRYSTDSSDSNIFCSFNDSLSVLQIKDTGSLGTGIHTVQCALQQIIPENFTSDGSFLAEFGDNVTREAVLTVTDFSTDATTANAGVTQPSLAAAAVGSALILIGITMAILMLILFLRYKKTCPKVKWRMRQYEEGYEMEGKKEMVPPESPISPNKQFHARYSPILMGQNANTNTRGQFYSAESILSVKSGNSGLSYDDDMSSPPSPAVSSYQGDDNGNVTCVVLEHPESERAAPSISMTNEVNVSSDVVAFIYNADHPRDQLSNGCHQRQDSGVSHTSSSTHHSPSSQTTNYGIPNLFGELSQHHDNGNPAPSLGVPHPNPGSEGSTYNDMGNRWQRSDTEIDSVLLEAVGCLMYREDCQIPRCLCRQVKVRFNSLMAEPPLLVRRATEPPLLVQRATEREGTKSGRFEVRDHQQQEKVPREWSPHLDTHYGMKLKSHMRERRWGKGRGIFHHKRSRSMELTPVLEHPGESYTSSVTLSDDEGSLPSGLTTSPTDAEETLGFLFPRSSSEDYPVLLRGKSFSADNIPALCLNDTLMATTPPSTEVTMAMQPLKPPSEVTMTIKPSKPPSEVTMAIQPSKPPSEVTMAIQPSKPPSEVTMSIQPSKPPSEVTMAIQPPSSLRTASHQMMSSLDNTDNNSAFNGQDNADIPPNETAPAIYCGECPIPEFMTPITTLSDVTSAGVRYENAVNDFTLEVPEGAVPETERLTLDVAVALFGPFQFPEGLRPVSPVFWVCVRDQRSFFFSRPVSVTLPHFLDLGSEEDVKSLGLTFLKASHSKNSEGMHEFSKTDGEVDFERSRRFGVLKTSHFCSLCIASTDRPECLRMTQFCLTSLLPRSTVSVGKKQYAYFFVTFCNLSTCLTRVDELIAERMSSGEYEKLQLGFRFKKFTKNPSLEMVVTQPKHGKVGVMGKKKILRSEVDFFVRERTAVEQMKMQEDKDFYPPRFQVFLASSPKDPTLSDGSIRFKGADSGLRYDIYLDLPDQDTGPSTTPPCPTSLPLVSGLIKLGTDDLFKVKEKLTEAGMAVRWRHIGLTLGLRDHQLDLIQRDHRTSEDCLTAMASEWLRQTYDVTEHGVPSLERLSEAVSKPAGGNNPSAAEEILTNWTQLTER